MKAHIPDPNPGMEELEQLFQAKLKQASLNGFLLGGHTALKMALDRYGEDIRNATTFEELQPLALELLQYLENKSQGLADVAEGKADE